MEDNNITEITIDENVMTTDEEQKKICSFEFLYKKEVIYKFNLYTMPGVEPKSVEMKDIYNYFRSKPVDNKELGNFFKMFGLIRYVFNDIVITIGDAAVQDIIDIFKTTIENYIKIAKIKHFEVEIKRE